MLKCSIIDNGVGISDIDMKKLFKIFSKLKKTESHNSSGTGLGLFISKKIAENLGGDIKVNSEVGRGSEFTFTMQIKPAEIEDLQSLDSSSYQSSVSLDRSPYIEDRGHTIAIKSDSIFEKIVHQES